MTPTEKLQNSAARLARTPTAPKLPTKRKMLSGIEGVGNNILLIGAPETGKSSFIADLAMNGLKTLTIFTDLGNTGLNGMRTYAQSSKKLKEFDENHKYILFSRDELEGVEAFLENPSEYVEGFAEFKPDVLAWDGLGFHISMAIAQDIEELVNKDKNFEGVGFDPTVLLKGWGYVKNAIVRVLDKYLLLPAAIKIATVGCKYQQIVEGDPGNPSSIRKQIPLDEPDIPTGAKRIIQHGFDLGLVTKIATRDEGDIKKGNYYYKLSGDYCKKRYKLPEMVKAGAFNLLTEIEKQRK